MNNLLYHSIDPIGIILKCKQNAEQIPVSIWGHRDVYLGDGNKAKLGILNLLLEEEKAIYSEDGFEVVIPHNVLAGLASWETKNLGLPAVAPFRLVIETHGTLANENFKVEYGFAYPDSLPVSFSQRNGAVLSCGKSDYLLSNPMFSVVELLDEYRANPIRDMDQRFLWWGKVRELLPDNVKIGEFLRTINIVKPENFTLDFSERDGDLFITPRFVLPKEPYEDEEIVSDTKEPQNIIPQAVHEDFVSNFLRQPSVKIRYALSERWFIVLPHILRTALDTVRKLKDESIEKKLAFLHNPKAELRKHLEGLVEEEIFEELFIETPLFLNERIKYLGIWQPKAGLFIKTESGQWFPEDGIPPAVRIPMNGGIYTVATLDLHALRKVMEEAQGTGLQEVKYGETVYPVNNKSLAGVKRALQVFGFPEKPVKKREKDEPTKTDKKADGNFVPIIYDHIKELGIYLDAKGRRKCVHEGIPQIAPGVKLHEHQMLGLKWLQDHWRHASPGALLADDMGLGKTLQALSFMSWVKLQMDNGCIPTSPFLVVAPTALLKNWEAESEKFLSPQRLGQLFKAHGNKFRPIVDEGWGPASAKLKEAGWVITTYETLRDKIMYFTAIHWAVAIFDEAQKIKNPKAMVTDMAKSIKAEFTLSLTGTPVENSLVDLWCIIDGVSPGRLKTLKEFSRLFMPNGKAEEKELKYLKLEVSSPPEFPLMLRRSKDEHWKERPGKHESTHEVKMPLDQAMAYSEAVDKFRNEPKQKGSMLRALQSLRAISLHPFLQETLEDHQMFINNSARLKATFELLDEIYKKNEKALIFVEYLTMQSAISEIIERKYGCRKVMLINGKVSGVKRQARVDEFQKEQNGFDVMILSPKAGGVGLNLTAANHVIHLSRWWNPAVEDQCSDRAYRIGQTKSVTIHYPLAIHPDYGHEQSFDVKLHDLLKKKRYLSQTLLSPPAGSADDINWLYEQSIGGKDSSSISSKKRPDRFQGANEQIDIERIDLMEPIEFERWVLGRFESKGYEKKLTPISGDAGSDGIVIAPEGTGYQSYIIQCKHTQRDKNINHNAVEEVLNSLDRYENLPDEIQPMVVTNATGFTIKANLLARNRKVKLVARSTLSSL